MSGYNKTSVFKKGVYIYLGVLAVLIAVLLAILWAFLSSYQQSLPETVANEILGGMDEEEWKTILAQGVYGSPFSKKEEDVNFAYNTFIKDKELKLRRNVLESTDSKQIFKIVSEGMELCSISLSQTDSGAFGMARWATEDETLAESFLEQVNPQTLLYLPKDGSFTVNGVSASLEGEACANPLSTPFEKKDETLFVKYAFRSPCGGGEIKASLNGKELKAVKNDGGAVVCDLNGDRIEQTVTVPKGAEVYVNDIRLTTEYISEKDVAYPFLNPLEKELENAPKSTVYKISGLYNTPELRVVYDGEELESEEREGKALYRFKNSGMDYTLQLPKNAIVTVNGIDISGKDEYISSKGVEYFDVRAYKEELVNPSVCNVYTLKGMLFVPEILVKDSAGKEYSLTQSSAGEYSCKELPKETLIEEYTVLANSFTVDMMEYMFYGREMLAETFSKVLSHTRKNSQAYNSIYDSYAGMYWRRTHTITYNHLSFDGFVRLADNAFSCDVHYDVTGNAVTVNRVDYAKGVYHLLFIKTNGNWEIVELALLDE